MVQFITKASAMRVDLVQAGIDSAIIKKFDEALMNVISSETPHAVEEYITRAIHGCIGKTIWKPDTVEFFTRYIDTCRELMISENGHHSTWVKHGTGGRGHDDDGWADQYVSIARGRNDFASVEGYWHYTSKTCKFEYIIVRDKCIKGNMNKDTTWKFTSLEEAFEKFEEVLLERM